MFNPTNLPTKSLLLASVFGAALVGTPAVYADDPSFSLSANTALTTDYRFRGLSLSDRDTAIQGGLDLNHKSGFYIGTWASSIEGFSGDTGGTSEVEVDIYAGYATEVANGLTADVGLLAYTYPGSDGTAYLEIYGSLSGTAGIVEWTTGAAYVWDQDNVGGTDNIYLYLDASVPLADTPIAFNGHIAYEDGAFGDNKWDWSLGASYSFEQFSLSANYIDTNVDDRIGSGAVVFALGASF